MPSTPEFEYHFRWADVVTEGWESAVDKLEARDQAIERKLAAGFGSCSVDFEFPYRWEQILTTEPQLQSVMLEMRDEAIEKAINGSGGSCRLEYPFRWPQFWEALRDEEPWAVGIADEHDKTLEMLLGLCSCGVTGLTIYSNKPVYSVFQTEELNTVSEGTIFTLARAYVVFDGDYTFSYPEQLKFMNNGADVGSTTVARTDYLSSVTGGVEYDMTILTSFVQIEPGTNNDRVYFSGGDSFGGTATFYAVMEEVGSTYPLSWHGLESQAICARSHLPGGAYIDNEVPYNPGTVYSDTYTFTESGIISFVNYTWDNVALAIWGTSVASSLEIDYGSGFVTVDSVSEGSVSQIWNNFSTGLSIPYSAGDVVRLKLVNLRTDPLLAPSSTTYFGFQPPYNLNIPLAWQLP